LAYWGRIVYEVYAILWLVAGFIFGILWGLVFYDYGYVYYDNYNSVYYTATTVFWIFYFLVWAFWASIYLYFAQVIFSFTKELGLGHMDVIDGHHTAHIHVTAPIMPQQNYMPPQYGHSPHVVVVNTNPNVPNQNMGYGQPIQPITHFSQPQVNPNQVQPQPIQPITQFTQPQVNPNYQPQMGQNYINPNVNTNTNAQNYNNPNDFTGQ